MYRVIDGCRFGGPAPRLFREVFLYGDEGIPLQGNTVINRFVNFPDDQLLIWLMQHENRELTRIDGVTLPLIGDWSDNFWHWCYEALPVALTAHEGGFTGCYLAPDIPFAVDALKLLGIRADRIRRANGGDYYLDCMCLHGKTPGYDPAMLPALARVRTVFRSALAHGAPTERLYLSRNLTPETRRRVVNEAELLGLLERFGFRTLYPEQLSLEEQLAHTCNASALIGPHGAGMTHCSFMPEASLVLELFAPSYVNPCVLPACRALKHRYFQVTSFCPHTGYRHGQDIEAMLPIVEMTLTRELG
jgi:capsular polysaccharide biosynthesis protein